MEVDEPCLCDNGSTERTPALTAVGSATNDTIFEIEPEYVSDGGREAWTVVLGSCLTLIASTGVINTHVDAITCLLTSKLVDQTVVVGIFQAYYQTSLLPSTPPPVISLVVSLQTFLLYSIGPFVGRIFDACGTTVMLPLGSLICVVSLMMVSLARTDQAYQVFLPHGAFFGIGVSPLFSPSVAVLRHWFRRKRALAIGLTTRGSAIGGIILPIVLKNLIPRVGFGWAVHIMAFILMGCLTIARLTIRARLPLTRDISLRTAVDFGGFRDPRYTLAAIGSFLLLFVFFVPYSYIQVYAEMRGVPPHISGYLLSILNAMNIPSRVGTSLLANGYGALNLYIAAAAICSILILALWLTSQGATSIVAFTALYGLFSGASVSLIPTYIATISPREIYGAPG